MFCDEKIVSVYLQRFKYDYPGAAFSFDYFDDIVFYTTDEYKIVLETKNHMLSIGASGIFNYQKSDFVLGDSERLENNIVELPGDDECCIGFETELFVGERLLNVEKKKDIFLLTFDDFTMRVMPFHYKELNSEGKCRDLLAFNRVAGCDRYIKRNCNCGGTAEILYRSLPGYIVRCKNCNKSTAGFDTVFEAADSWNSEKVLC